jgi:16S rRNA (cytosine1402-N4)-methyltransferase
MPSSALHQPVLLTEAVELLQVQPKTWYVDATFGRGGHTKAILDQQAQVLAFDVDQEAIDYAQVEFSAEIEKGQLVIIRTNFSNLETEVNNFQSHQAETAPIRGILFDFGTSLDQIRAPHRGFSFDHPDAPLDMRMDQSLGITAADLLTVLSVKQMTDLFRDYGGEPHAKKIAQAIDRHRGKTRSNRIETVGELLEVAFKDIPRKSHLHPATKVLQALRIAVNDELSSIEQVLPQALKVLDTGGRIVTIAFHQGEDSLVKHQFKYWQDQDKGSVITKKAVLPSEEEIEKNPRARSAKLRTFEKTN